jgi:Coenzyme PQQ synthesis protein D (PqqD)
MSARYRHNSGVVTEALGDGLVLVDLDRGTTFRLNRTGKVIWELLRQPRTRAELVGQMHGSWKVASQELERDVTALLTELLNNHLLEAREQR